MSVWDYLSWAFVWYAGVCLMVVVVGGGLCFAVHGWLVHKRHLQAPDLERVLQQLPFFHSFHVDPGEHTVPGLSQEIWADEAFTIVVKNSYGPIGLIGFVLSDESMIVLQLQGLKGVNTRGIDFGDFLLECAEQAAFTLGMRYVRVQPAHLNVYYELDDQHALYPQLYAHQDRMRKLYNSAPENRDYEVCFDHRFRAWREKYIGQAPAAHRMEQHLTAPKKHTHEVYAK